MLACSYALPLALTTLVVHVCATAHLLPSVLEVRAPRALLVASQKARTSPKANDSQQCERPVHDSRNEKSLNKVFSGGLGRLDTAWQWMQIENCSNMCVCAFMCWDNQRLVSFAVP